MRYKFHPFCYIGSEGPCLRLSTRAGGLNQCTFLFDLFLLFTLFSSGMRGMRFASLTTAAMLNVDRLWGNIVKYSGRCRDP